jgi:apolipoprotein N-acyltransferase
VPKLKRAFFYIITGILLAAAYPPINVYTLYFAGFAFLIYIINSSSTLKSAFLRTYFVFLSFESVTVSWISLSGLRENADKFMIIGGLVTMIIHSGLLSIPPAIYYLIRKSFLRKYSGRTAELLTVFILPFIYVAFEYLYELPEVSFPWVIAGNAFTTAVSKIQFIEITGVFGLSFWAVFISCMLYIIFELARKQEGGPAQVFKSKKITVLLAVTVLLYIIPDFYSAFTSAREKYSGTASGRKLKVAVLQPNINPWKKWGAKQTELVNDYAGMIKDADPLKTELMILPETAVPFHLLDDFYSRKYLIFRDIIDSIKTPLLMGTPDIVYYNDSITVKKDYKENKSSKEKYDTFNSAVLIQPDEPKISHQKYAKIKLVIGSERMPYQERIPVLKNMVKWSVGLSSFQIGWDTTIFRLADKAKFNTAICYESIYPEFFSTFVDKGAEFCVIITNDGWWGKLSGTHQHNQYAVLRAIENRRWIARCANTGISCFIDPYGNMYNETAINEKSIIKGEVGLRDEKTFYTLHPSLFPGIITAIAGMLVLTGTVISFLSRKKKSHEV